MAKRDLDTWCLGKVGVEHVPVLTLDTTLGRMGKCKKDGKTSWVCVHSIVCEKCKRFLKRSWQMGKEECPQYKK